MKARKHAAAEAGQFPMRKLIVGMMALAVAAVFTASFINGPMPPQAQGGSQKAVKRDEMAAVPALMARVKDNPKDEEAVLELAELFSRTQDWQKSAHFWTKAVELNAKNLGARYHRGFTMVQLERYDEAAADYEFIIQAKPDAYQAFYYLGIINKYGYKKPDEARKYFQKALDINPSDKEIVSEIQKEISEIK